MCKTKKGNKMSSILSEVRDGYFMTPFKARVQKAWDELESAYHKAIKDRDEVLEGGQVLKNI